VLTLRVGAALAVLIVEYLLLAVRLDGSNVSRNVGVWGELANVGATISVGFAVLSAGLIRKRDVVMTAVAELETKVGAFELRWCAAHLVAFGAFAACSERVFAPGGLSPTHAAAWVTVWLVLVLLTVMSLLRAVFGGAWWVLARALVRVGWAGLLLGLVAYRAGLWSQALWPWLARRTLELATFLLTLVTSDVYANPSMNIIGLHGVEVEIAQGCSGIEGIGLVLVLVGGYLFTFRERLALARALWLLPLSVTTVWILNGLRVAGLVAVAAWISPAIAFGGFHSKAGWIAVCAVALGTVSLAERSSFFVRDPRPAVETENPTGAYLMPLLALLGVGLVTGAFAREIDWFYGARLVAVLVTLYVYRRYYGRVATAPSPFALATGAAVFVLWLVLVPASGTAPAAFAHAAPALRIAWLAVRVAGTILVVPIAEELAFRGFLQRRLLARDFEAVPFDRFSWPSLIVSALAFGALHESFWAGTLAGIAYSAAAYRRGELADAIFAHATTNALLALAALVLGRWDLLA
jgi:exosortase E/protease (VPEID-CTERM system)